MENRGGGDVVVSQNPTIVGECGPGSHKLGTEDRRVCHSESGLLFSLGPSILCHC